MLRRTSEYRNFESDSGTVMDVSRLAWLPIAFLVERDTLSERFAAETQLDAAYHGVAVTALWAYLLYSYQDLVRAYFGTELAQRVRCHQQVILENELAGNALTITRALRLVDEVNRVTPVDLATRRDEAAGRAMELAVSMTLLRNLPGSPDYSVQGRRSAGPFAPGEAGIDRVLAEFLARHRQRLLQTLVPVFEQAAGLARHHELQ